MREKFLAVVEWLRRSFKWIVAVLIGLALLSTLRACYYGGQVKQVLDTTKPLPQRAIRVLETKAQTEAAKAATAERQAARAIHHADSLGTVAAHATRQADSLHEEIKHLPTASGGPLAAVQRRLAAYQGVDTTSR